MIKIWVRRILYVGIALVAALIIFGFSFYQYLSQPAGDLLQTVRVEVKPGTGFSRLARDLNQQGLISRPKWWTAFAVLSSKSGKIQAGEYQVEPGTSPLQLLDQLVKGDVIRYQITFVEGWRFNELLEKLAQQKKLTRQLEGLTPEQVMAKLGFPEQHPEGQFFSDSYQYVSGESDLKILQRAYDKLKEVLTEEWQQRADYLPYETPYEALVMASIIEKETGVAEERGEIAGVFVRRLDRGMRLQTDPTVIYGLGDQYQGDLKRKHLSQKTPYNTYVIKGLPPTPIAMVGRAAIHAALNPTPGTSLYFVARGDGTHIFSDTLKQHQEAVRKYQIKQRSKQYRSSPN